MAMHPDLGEFLAQLHQTADEDDTIDVTLRAIHSLIHCDHVGIMLVDGREVTSVATTDALVAEADRLQMVHDDGPCLSAISGDDTFSIDDTAVESRWSAWCRDTAALGLHSVLSVGIPGGPGDAVGSLNLYSTRRSAFDDDDDRAMAQVLGRHAALALSRVRRGSAVTHAIDTRTRIGQAQGILMSVHDLDADQAMAVLARYAGHHGFKLRDVASGVIATRELPPPLVPPLSR